MKKLKNMFVLILIFSISLSNIVFSENINEKEYKEAYTKKLIEFRENDELLDGEKPIGKDAALVSHFNGKIPALFTISYYKGKGNNDVYNYKYRVYIYEEGKVNLVRLGQNAIDNDADYNFYVSNVGGDMPSMFKNNYYVLKNKNTDFRYLVTEQEFFEEPTFDETEEYYDPWEADGYNVIKYIAEDFMTDNDKEIISTFKELSHYINKEKENRYFLYEDGKPENILKSKYDEKINKVKNENEIRLLKPKKLTEKEIEEILNDNIKTDIKENKNIKIVINDKEIELNTEPIIINQRTLVPIRSIFEALDIEVNWDGKNRIVTGTKENTIMKIKIDSDIAYINDKEIKLDSVAIINKDNRTLVPVRFVAEAIGAEVNWISETRTVDIKLK